MFAENLARLMKARGVGPSELAEVAHVHRTAVHLWLRGGGISDSRLEKIAAYLGVSPAGLRFGAGHVEERTLQDIMSLVQTACEQANVSLSTEKRSRLVAMLYARQVAGQAVTLKDAADLVSLAA